MKQSIWSHKQASCSGKNFKEVVDVKSTKTAKFIVLENLRLYGSCTDAPTSIVRINKIFLPLREQQVANWKSKVLTKVQCVASYNDF